MASAQNDFSKGSVVGNIMGMAIPMTAAQLINLLYNVVDRIYIGYIPEHATLSLTGLGVCLPVITAVMAFANLILRRGKVYILPAWHSECNIVRHYIISTIGH